jgi:lysophospholipase L1-like esterase
MAVRTALVNLLLVIGGCGAVLGGLEIALRLAGYAPAAFEHTNRIASPGRAVLLDCYPTNPRRYFDVDLRDPATFERYRALGLSRLDEAASKTPFAVERRYSAQQFRGPEIGPHRVGILRVAVIGDSFTEGMGVKEEDVYPRVLHRLLGTGGEPARFEVLNLGRRGYDFPALYDLFLSALAFEPDIVVYGMVLNDAERTEEFQARQVYLNDWILDRGRMFRDGRDARLRPWNSRLAAFLRDRVDSYRVGRDTTRWYRDMYGAPNQAGWERTQGLLRDMHQRMEARGGAFLVASWPLLVGLEGRYPFAEVTDTIRRFLLSAGIPHHDLLPALSGRPSATLWVHPVDHHPNDIAHRLAAESLAPVVRSLSADVARQDGRRRDPRRGRGGRPEASAPSASSLDTSRKVALLPRARAIASKNALAMISAPSALGWMWSTKSRLVSPTARKARSMSARGTPCSRASSRICTSTPATHSLRWGGARKSKPSLTGGMVASTGRLPPPFAERTMSRRLGMVKHVVASLRTLLHSDWP